MPKNYAFTLTIPRGRSEAEADDLESLAILVPSGISERLRPGKEAAFEENIDKAAIEVLRTYRQKYTRNLHTSIASGGCELDLIKCYLHGFTANQALDWLWVNRKFRASRSAIGRYWTALCKAGCMRDRIYKEFRDGKNNS